MAGQWKKLLYSNNQGTTLKDSYALADQTGLTPGDITPIWFEQDAAIDGGGTTTGYNNDGAFDNLSGSVPYVLKMVNGSTKPLFDEHGAEVQSGITDKTLVWGRGTEEHTVMAELANGDATTLSNGVFPIGTADYSIKDSNMSYSGNTYTLKGTYVAADAEANPVVEESDPAGSLTLTNQAGDAYGDFTGGTITLEGSGNVISINSGGTTITNAGVISAASTITGTTLTGTAALNGTTLGIGTTDYDNLTITNAGVLSTDGTISTTNATDSSNTTSGALTTAGGLGVAKKANIGETLGVAGACSLDTGGTGSSFGGDLDVAGDFSVATNQFQVASGSGDTVIGGTLSVGGDTTITGNIDHNGSVASLANGAMEITAGNANSGLSLTTSALSGANPAGSNVTVEITNSTEADKTFTIGDAYYFVSDANTTVELEVAGGNVTVSAGSAGDVEFDVISWPNYSDVDGSGTDDSVALNSVLYDEAPSLSIVTFNQGVTFQGSTTIVDSTNTALTDGVVLINKDASTNNFSSTDNPALVFGVESASNPKNHIGRLQFNNTEGFFSLGHGIGTDPDVNSEDVTTLSSAFHGLKAGFMALVDGPSTVTQNGTSQGYVGTTSDTLNMIACDNAGVPHIWIGAAG